MGWLRLTCPGLVWSGCTRPAPSAITTRCIHTHTHPDLFWIPEEDCEFLHEVVHGFIATEGDPIQAGDVKKSQSKHVAKLESMARKFQLQMHSDTGEAARGAEGTTRVNPCE